MGFYGLYMGRKIVKPPEYINGTFWLTLEGGNTVVVPESAMPGAKNGVHRRTSPQIPSNPPSSTPAGYPGPGASDTSEGAGEGASEARIRAGEIRAWRMWRVVKPDGDHILQSIAMKNLWVPGEPMTGSPGRPGMHNDVVHCQGIYSYKSQQALQGHSYYRDVIGSHLANWQYANTELRPYKCEHVVCGEVDIWGEVHEYTLGYLSEYARPKGFYKSVRCNPDSPEPEDLLMELRYAYLRG